MNRRVTVAGTDRLDECLAIRRVVFIDGQNVPESLEVDGLDPECMHFIAELDGRAVGTARLRFKADGGKVQRVAVLAECRGLGIGRDLMLALHRAALHAGVTHLELHAQEAVIGFYEDLGYVSVGDRFVEADIVHQAMVINLAAE